MSDILSVLIGVLIGVLASVPVAMVIAASVNSQSHPRRESEAPKVTSEPPTRAMVVFDPNTQEVRHDLSIHGRR